MIGSWRFLLKPNKNFVMVTRQKTQLNQAIREAERIVGYSTSFLNLRWLLTDEISNVALHVRKLVGTRHPLLKTARKLFLGNEIPNWGIIVLLMSKAAGLHKCENDLDKDRTAGVLNSQRVLAEVTEMIRTSFTLHKSVANIHNTDYLVDFHFGNRMALLSGDFLLSKSFNELAEICNNDVSFIMSSTLRDLVESEFLDCKPCKPVATTEFLSIQNVLGYDGLSHKSVGGNPRAEWVYRNILGGASLLAKACQCALMLGKHSESVQQLGYVIGANIALAWQAQLERESFSTNSPISLVSAPVMLHLEQDIDLFKLIDSHQIDYKELQKRISSGKGLKAAKILQDEFCTSALNALKELPKTDARTALENIIKTID